MTRCGRSRATYPKICDELEGTYAPSHPASAQPAFRCARAAVVPLRVLPVPRAEAHGGRDARERAVLCLRWALSSSTCQRGGRMREAGTWW